MESNRVISEETTRECPGDDTDEIVEMRPMKPEELQKRMEL